MTSLLPIPSTASDLTPAWLTTALKGSGAVDSTTSVRAVRIEQIAEGVGFLSYIYRLHLDLDGPGPASLIAKLPTDTAYLQLAQLTGAYIREVRFYADVAPSAPLRTAQAHVSRMDEETAAFVLLLEDLGGLDAGDHLDGLHIERVERVIDALAEFHAWAWGLKPDVTRAQPFLSIDDPITQGLYSMGVPAGWATYQDHGQVPITSRLGAFIDQFAHHLPRLLGSVSEPPTLLNGDLRADNLFFDTTDTPVLVDFQFASRGAGIWDISYLIGQGMTPAQRAGRERQLVERYVAALASHGVHGYGFDESWRQFQAALLAQITFPLTAMTSWDTLNERAKELLHSLMERAIAIIEDTDALSVLGD